MSAKPAAKTSAHTPQPVSSKWTFLLGGLALVVIAAVVAFGVMRSGEQLKIRNDGYGTVRNSAVTVRLEPDGVAALGKPDARKTIDIYEDAICPSCGGLERLFGQELAQAVDEGKLAIRYHLLDFLNRQSGSGNYSTRAAAASQCVAEGGDGPLFARFHALLFVESQPAEGGSDHDNQRLAEFAKKAGAQDKTVQCIKDGSKTEQAGNAAAGARKSMMDAVGEVRTPTILVNGTDVDIKDKEWVVRLTS